MKQDIENTLKTYFMDQATKSSMRASGIDPFEQYGIISSEQNPLAVSSYGPVKVGMGIEKTLPITNGIIK